MLLIVIWYNQALCLFPNESAKVRQISQNNDFFARMPEKDTFLERGRPLESFIGRVFRVKGNPNDSLGYFIF